MKSARLFMLISILLAMLGMLLAAYLTMLSLSSDPVAGCGGNAGCEEVLTSRWSAIGPVPVSLLGLLTYLAILLGLGARMGSKGYSPLGDRLLWLTPPMLIVAAIWFTGVQLVDVQAFCPFCMASHAVGFVLALLLIFGVMRTTIAKPKVPILLGFLAGGALIISQLAIPASQGPVQRAPNPFVDQDGDAVIDDLRYLSLFGGELQFVLEEVPHIGDPRAEQVVVVLFDYACPYCKTLHNMLDKAIAENPTRFVLVPIPLSIHEKINPYVASDQERFEYSHLLATYAMVAGAIDLETYKAFDRWLFNSDGDGEFPRNHNDAINKAVDLFNGDEFKDELSEKSEHYQAVVKRNIELLGLLPEDKRFIPVTTTPGAPSHLTERFDDVAVLYALLDEAKINLDGAATNDADNGTESTP